MLPAAGMPTPKLDTSDEVAKVDQEFAGIVKQAEELASHSEKRIKELKAELQSVQAEKVRCGLRSPTVDNCHSSRTKAEPTRAEYLPLTLAWQTL